MDLSKLHTLSTEALQTLKNGVENILNSRLDTTLRHGREVTFEAQGVMRTARVERINHKTVTVTELSPDSGKKWRVSKNLLSVKPEIRKEPLPTIPLKVPHKPANYKGDIW